MKKIIIALFHLLFLVPPIYAQDLKLFVISEVNEKTVFTSLSDIYENDARSDGLVIPVSNRSLEHFKLNSKSRKQFLSKTKISESDNIFLYDYSKNQLVSLTVKKTNVVAKLSPYETGRETLHSQFDYMIGFEINKDLLKDFENYGQTLIYIGKENPFAKEQLIPIPWEKINSIESPLRKADGRFNATSQNYVIEDSYHFKFKNLEYFIQNISRERYIFARKLLIVDLQTKSVIYEKTFKESESTSLTPLNFINNANENPSNQWTGKLFKNKKTVIFGFKYHSFGCEEITVLSKKPNQIGIYCDNRH